MSNINELWHEKHQVNVVIRDFIALPRLILKSSTFTFDSWNTGLEHGWYMLIKQRHFNQTPTKLIVVLKKKNCNNTKIVLRFPSTANNSLITSIDSVVALFSEGGVRSLNIDTFQPIIENNTQFETSEVFFASRGIESYTDEHLLQILQQRSLKRQEQFKRTYKPKAVEIKTIQQLDNVVKLYTKQPQSKQIQQIIDWIAA